MYRRVLMIAILALAACATPQERCLDAATRDLRTLDGLIAETRANLDRGFAIDVETVPINSITSCGFGYPGRWGYGFCDTVRYVDRERPRAIDPAAEERKLRDLNARRGAVEERTVRAVATCEASF